MLPLPAHLVAGPQNTNLLQRSQTQILATFDDLVARDVILYGPATVQRTSDKGFAFEFRICPALSSKPFTPDDDAPTTTTSSSSTDQEDNDEDDGQSQPVDEPKKYGPGSDLIDPDPALLIANVLDEHILVLNIFCIFRPQYIMLTKDSYKRQTQPLCASDLAAAWTVLDALGSETHYAIFNCGPEAGCSRFHKHMQVFPKPDDFTMFPDLGKDEMNPEKVVPFKYFIDFRSRSKFSSSAAENPVEWLQAAYARLLEEAEQAFQSTAASETLDYFPHDVVATSRWIVVVPRRKADVGGASANAAGMMGMVWIKKEEELSQWKNLGPTAVLAQVGIPAEPRQNGGV